MKPEAMKRLLICACACFVFVGSGRLEAQTKPSQAVEPCVGRATRDEPAPEDPAIPVTDWAASGEASQIPWTFQFKDPELRIDQRYEVGYSATIQSKDLGWSSDNQELVYVVGVMNSENTQVIPPKWTHQTFESAAGKNFRIEFAGCVFLQPGTFVAWAAVIDPKTQQHSLTTHRIRPPEFASELLPNANSLLPPAEFPDVTSEANARQIKPGPLSLPVSNRRQIDLDLVSVLSPVDQWPERTDLARSIDSRVLAATGVFSQTHLAAGSVSVFSIDAVNRNIAFEQRGIQDLDWGSIAAEFHNPKKLHTIAAPALKASKERGGVFRDQLNEILTEPGDRLRVMILITGSLLFERAGDIAPLKVEGDCNCKVYHVRFQVGKDDVFDDLGKILRPLKPKTFDVHSPQEFRKALAAILEDLNRL